ncbi:MAG: ABC transporter permease [Clostridiaceae bacterium]
MKTLALIRGDIRFQLKYGFYLLYLLFSLLYIGLLFAFPASWREQAAALMILTDPAAMGLFFMGAIVLFEKNERVLDSLAVAPVKPWQYVVSKLVSIGVISVLVSLAIGLPAGLTAHPLRLALGVFLSSCLFSSIGLMAACASKTLNQFMLLTVPAELLIFVPAVIWLFWGAGWWMRLHPGAAALELCQPQGAALLPLAVLLVWAAGFALLAVRAVERMLLKLGGMKL